MSLSLDGCCGTLNFDYRAHRNVWELELAFILPKLAVGGEQLQVPGYDDAP